MNKSSGEVKDLAAEREKRILARRNAIVGLLRDPSMPGADYVNAATREVHLDEVSVTYFRRGLALFGVTDLDPEPPENFDRLMATWRTLLSVGSELLGRAHFGAESNLAERRIWHPAYLAYIEALWAGDEASVRRAARELGVHAGVEAPTALLWQGPSAVAPRL